MARWQIRTLTEPVLPPIPAPGLALYPDLIGRAARRAIAPDSFGPALVPVPFIAQAWPDAPPRAAARALPPGFFADPAAPLFADDWIGQYPAWIIRAPLAGRGGPGAWVRFPPPVPARVIVILTFPLAATRLMDFALAAVRSMAFTLEV